MPRIEAFIDGSDLVASEGDGQFKRYPLVELLNGYNKLIIRMTALENRVQRVGRKLERRSNKKC